MWPRWCGHEANPSLRRHEIDTDGAYVGALVGVPLILAFLALACSSEKAATAEKTDAPPAPAASPIRVDGSSTVFPITEAVAEEFRKAGNAAQVTVGISGTGGGFKKFCAGETDLSDASRPIKQSEIDLCAQNGIGWVELPVAYDGLAILVNPANDWATSITVDELKKIWEPAAQQTVTRWSQVRAGWPDQEIHLYGPGVDSGTYDYFTEAICGKEDASRGDYTSSEDDNVLVQGISGDKGALGFFGFAYFEENKDKLKLVPVDDGKAENGAGPIAASVAAVQDATYQPLSRPLFVYVSTKALGRPEIQSFVDFYLDQAPKLASEVGYIPLPGDAYAKVKARVAARKEGSVFANHGSQVGVKIEQLVGDPGVAAAPATTDAAAAPAAEGAAPAAPAAK